MCSDSAFLLHIENENFDPVNKGLMFSFSLHPLAEPSCTVNINKFHSLVCRLMIKLKSVHLLEVARYLTKLTKFRVCAVPNNS